MTGSKATDLSAITTDNIIKPTLEKLSEDHRQAYEARKKERQDELDALKKKRDEEFEAL